MRHVWIAVFLAAGGIASAAPAWGATRDDVMAASARCAGIADDRTWLNCYYGAAQPMRARLGLPSAPASQVRLVPPAQGYTAPAYAAAPVQQAAVAPPPKKKSGGFLSGLFGSGNDEAAQRLASYSFDHSGLFTVTLADGEVWKQRSDDINQAHWRDAAANHVVSIATGAFGTATLEDHGDGTVYTVTRVR